MYEEKEHFFAIVGISAAIMFVIWCLKQNRNVEQELAEVTKGNKSINTGSSDGAKEDSIPKGKGNRKKKGEPIASSSSSQQIDQAPQQKGKKKKVEFAAAASSSSQIELEDSSDHETLTTLVDQTLEEKEEEKEVEPIASSSSSQQIGQAPQQKGKKKKVEFAAAASSSPQMGLGGSSDDGPWTLVGKTQAQRDKEKEAQQARKDKKEQIRAQIETALGRYYEGWLKEETTDGTLDVHGRGSHNEHNEERLAKEDLKSGNIKSAIEHLNNAILLRSASLREGPGYDGHLGWIQKLERIKARLEALLKTLQ